MPNSIINYISIVLIGLLFSQTSLCQEYSFQKFEVEDGLSQSVATTMAQDNQGALWIGSMSGLTKYDGHQLIRYSEKDGLAEDWITASYRDTEGNLWFGHWGGGMTIWYPDSNTFRNLNFEKYSSFKTVTSILQDKHGNIWFSTDGSGVLVYEVSSQTILTITEDEGFLSNNAYSLCHDTQKNIWIGTSNGIAIYNSNKEIGSKGAVSVLTTSDGLSSNSVEKIILLKNKKMLVSGTFSGLDVIDIKNGKVAIEHINKENFLPSNDVSCILQDASENLWVGTKDEGVVKINLADAKSQVFSTRQGLNYFNVKSLLQDRENNIWVGTDLGINLFKGEQFLIYNEKDEIINNIVWSVTGDQNSNIWLGTNKGLSKLSIDAETNHTDQTSVKNYTVKNGLSHEMVLSVYAAKDGKIWCGTGLGGVNILNNGKFSTIDTKNGLASNTVFSITQDASGYYWFGTTEGASRYDPESKEVINFDEKDGLGGKHVYKIFKDSKGRLWFSVLGGYLSLYENNQFVKYDSLKGLNEKFITCISEDKNGNIWFGAYGSGVFKYDGKEFVNFSIEQGLSSNFPYSIACDDENKLWIGTSRGIDQFDQKEQFFKNYRKREGFLGIEANPNAIYRDRSGNIWVGTIMGVARFDLSKKFINHQEPNIQFDDPLINRETTSLANDASLSYKQNNITFNFKGISLTNPQHIKYQYMLEGYDTDWSLVSQQNNATYSNLPHGSYTFKVKASNSDNIWTEQPVAIHFSISPPFWKTWWFYVITSLALLVLVYYGDKIRTRKLKEANTRLESKVAERTSELADKNTELAKKNQDILDSIQYAKRIQNAILPSESELKKSLPNSFVFYQPKDIVSGDFYWLEVVDEKVLFAAADCTGHGVPGAFMSIIGYNGLNKVVKENGITKPSEILNQLSEIVESTLQYEDNKEVSDGLDIAICALDIKKMKLEYAGAFNPLYMVRNGELIETKASRSVVGGSVIFKDKAGKFENHEVELQKNDSLYIFSDGIPDQFGGPKGKKFRYSQFKELLSLASNEPMSKQKNIIDKTIKNWMGEIEQIDDMVVMGVRIV